jgi:hypothetical protein
VPNPTQKQGLLDAVNQIRSAEQLLLQASRVTSDPATLIQINTEYAHMDSFLSQMLHAQALADDAEFSRAVTALKGQISTLSADEASMKKIIDDIATAGKVVAYIVKAIEIITKL